jgi:diaminopimelate epimerase
MHGAGNDFVVFDATREPLALTPRRIARLADRHRGIGCDQVLVVEPANQADTDFVYRIFNADGGEVEQCGNGARAFVRFVLEHQLTQKRAIRVSTMSGVIEPRLLDDDNIEVDMGCPAFSAEAVPFDATGLLPAGSSLAPRYQLDVAGSHLELSVCSMGNPHVVVLMDDIERADVARLGPALEHHARFPRRVNVGFSSTFDPHSIALRVYERGVGETLACGTGACAAVAVGIAQGRLESPVKVYTQGGTLSVSWDGDPSHAVMLSGPAVSVFEGEIDLSQLD